MYMYMYTNAATCIHTSLGPHAPASARADLLVAVVK